MNFIWLAIRRFKRLEAKWIFYTENYEPVFKGIGAVTFEPIDGDHLGASIAQFDDHRSS